MAVLTLVDASDPQQPERNSGRNTPRLLGAAFLFQAVTSLVSGLLLGSLIVSGDITATMTNIASNAFQVRASIVGEMFTAIGIASLGFLLYVTLKKQNETIALVALGAYLIEAAVLAASRIAVFSLLRTSQEAAIAGHPAYLQTLGNLFYEAESFGYSLLMLPFAVGATLFYYLLFTSRYVPRGLSLFGLVAASLSFVGILSVLLGYDVPIYVFLPNLPFEVGIGIWLMAKGFSSSPIASVSGVATPVPEGMTTRWIRWTR